MKKEYFNISEKHAYISELDHYIIKKRLNKLRF